MRTDIEEALRKFEVKGLGNNKNIERVESKLKADEKVLFIYRTNATITAVNTRKKEKLPGIFVLTDSRFIFMYKIMSNENVEVATLDTINSINYSANGLTPSHVVIHTMTKSYDILVSYKKSIMKLIQETFSNAQSTYESKMNDAVNSTTNIDIIAQIEKLSQLKEKGILSVEEFETKKAELLSRL